MSDKRVLIIDDDPDYVFSVELMLKGTRFSVFSAGRAEEGLESARGEVPDAIILDLMLPDLDGYSVCRRLREGPETAGIPILIATSLQRGTDRRYMARIARHHRADAFLEKPLERTVLVATLDRIMSKEASPGKSKPARPSALLVDDDPDFLMGLEKIFSSRGFEIYLAESGVEAVKLARTFLPDIVLLDVMLPDRDGFSVCLELKRDPKTRPIPILMLTAVGEEFTRPEYAKTIARDHMADDFAAKPVRTGDLMNKVDRLIGPPPSDPA